MSSTDNLSDLVARDTDARIPRTARLEQLRILVDNFPGTLAASLLVGLAMLLVQWNQSEHAMLLGWFTLLLLSTLIRGLLTYQCKRRLSADNASRWAGYFSIGAFTGGAVWGMGAIILLLEGDIDIAVFFVGGMAVGAIGVNASVLSVYRAFAIPMLVPPAVLFSLSDTPASWLKAGLTLFFLLVMLSVASRYNRALTRSLILALEHQKVSRELRRHRDHLQELVEEKTADLHAAIQTAEAANTAKSEFLANMTHELRTPMHAILSFAAIGQEQAADAPREKLADYFGYVHGSGKRLLALVNDLLDLSKFEAKRMSFDTRQHDMLEIAEDLKDELQGLLSEKDLVLELQHEAGSTNIYCDRTRIFQVMRNLISNAIKFSPERGKITIRLEPGAAPAGRRQSDTGEVEALKVSVLDEGIGVPSDELETIFDKFVQSSKTNSGAGGTGLGLAISREIVRAHGGAIAAHNRHHGGAAFTFSVPTSPVAGSLIMDRRITTEPMTQETIHSRDTEQTGG